MKFKINYASESPELLDQCNILIREIIKNGNEQIDSSQEANFVINLIDLDNPVAHRRKSHEEMVVSLALIQEPRTEMKSISYGALVKSLSNMLFCIIRPVGNEPPTAYSITPEVGFMEFRYSAETIYKYMYPVISSHFVIKNKISIDLPFAESQSFPEVTDLIEYGKELKKLGVLPTPFKLHNFLNQDQIDHLYRLYQIKGLSYGNLSIRNTNHGMNGSTFWMTARGVDKSQLKGVGTDIVLVKGYDKKLGNMLISVPLGYDPRIRVSVDAIEHYMIYKEFPDVGAIVHVHAWIENVKCTTQVYPCGTHELAKNAVALLKKTSSPERTEIGLKNHGLTITGPDIRDIFDRIRDKLQTNVPIFN